MLVYLVRHAIAVDHGTPGFDENERPLTEKGQRRMAQIVEGLDRLGVELDAIWASPLARARQTAEILCSLKGMSKLFISPKGERGSVVDVPQLAPGGDARELIDKIRSTDNISNLALVGHEPDLSELAGWLLIGNAHLPLLLKKGAVACLELDNSGQSVSATLQWLMQPHALRQLASDLSDF